MEDRRTVCASVLWSVSMCDDAKGGDGHVEKSGCPAPWWWIAFSSLVSKTVQLKPEDGKDGPAAWKKDYTLRQTFRQLVSRPLYSGGP